MPVDDHPATLMSPTGTASLPVPQEWDVEPEPAAVPPSRRLIRRIAEAWRVPMSDAALRDVELCASELLANAIEHTRAQCRVTVRWTGERLRVEVTDSSPTLPDREAAQDTVTGGRGLLLIEGLAHSWGSHPNGPGKTVWFECAADQSIMGARRLAVLLRAANDRTTGHPRRSA
ncbi:ATP-binding protein [Streptomyces sp. NRRL WC-3742]|uniref:ATP-binding protein n=1 Tax=Streptomyces sp. NRRL WC-3742 TaxID=1463934 RepID=UPI0004CBFF97|nr:ATP-binding protein [Streptomyces sp. NRRL WC-3742]